MLRDQVFVLDHMYMSLFSTCGWILRLGLTLVLLISIHPALGLLAVFALPTIFTATWRPGVERAVWEALAPEHRLARHLFVIATTAPAGKEVRVTGIGQSLVGRQRAAWERWYAPMAKARWNSAWWHTAGWAIFGAGFVGAVAFVSAVGAAGPGNVFARAGSGPSRLSAYIGATVGEIGFLRGIWLDGSKKLAWLEDYAAAQEERADAPVPEKLASGIRFEHVSFVYPGTDERLVLEDVCLEFKPGKVVAIVGENGAGKTTLVKLLVPVVRADEQVGFWRMGSSFSHACRRRCGGHGWPELFRISSGSSFGRGTRWESGMCTDLTTSRRSWQPFDRRGASDVVDQLAEGLETQLGATWPLGVEVSFGQWQKLALARGFMREQPLVLVLDEPTAALDAETEHALFERFAAAAREGRSTNGDQALGRITILVSHRFSTVSDGRI